MHANNTYALITGGSSGIGLELARLFAMDGHNLILVARNSAGLRKAVAELKEFDVDVILMSADFFGEGTAFNVYDEVKRLSLPVDILVNNAGQGQYGLFKDTDINRELAIIHLNISSLVVLTKLFLKDMLARRNGKILNISGLINEPSAPCQAIYDATKAFVQSFTLTLHNEVKDEGVTVTALLPGPTNTDFFHKAGMEAVHLVQNREHLADPAIVARQGYDALMRGDNKVIAGIAADMVAEMSL